MTKSRLIMQLQRVVGSDPQQAIERNFKAIEEWSRQEVDRDKVEQITTNYTVEKTDQILLADATLGSLAITLLPPGEVSGKTFRIKRISGGSNTVTVVVQDNTLIDGVTAFSFAAQYDARSFYSDGSTYHIL